MSKDNHVDDQAQVRPDLRPPLPLTVVGGFLGAGKTTLLNEMLSGPVDRRLAVVVNDFGSIDIDGKLIAAVHDDVVSLTNGCICCSIRDGVANTVLRLAERPTPPEHVVIEASGASEPGALAEVFIEMQRAGFVRLDGLVTAVNADDWDPGPDDSKNRTDPHRLARAQVQQADLLVLTKLDIADAATADDIREKIHAINPNARIIDKSDCTPDVLLGLRAAIRPTDGRLLAAHHHFQSGHVRLDDPVSFKVFLPLLTRLPAGVIRAKGWLSLIERPGDKILVHVVGRRIHVRTVGPWNDEPPHTELVFIGTQKGWSPQTLSDELAKAVGQSAGRSPDDEVPDRLDVERDVETGLDSD